MDFDLTAETQIATILGTVIAIVGLILAIRWQRSKAKKKEDGDRQSQDVSESQNGDQGSSTTGNINIGTLNIIGDGVSKETIESLFNKPIEEQKSIPLQIDETIRDLKEQNQKDEISERSENFSGYDFTTRSVPEQISETGYISKDTAEKLICMRKEWQNGNKSKVIQWLKGLKDGKWSLLSPEVKADVLIFEAEIELKESGNIRRARELADKAQNLIPSQNQNRIRALIAYHEEGPEEAIKVLGNQDDIDSLNLKADFLIELGRVEEAFEILNFGYKSNDDT